MIVLGLGGAVGHDPAAALVVDGRVIAAAEEERFNRDKHAKGLQAEQAAKFCLQFHLNLATKFRVAQDKLDLVAVWREAPQFSTRERAALAWTEALTQITHGVSDELYSDVRTEFSEKELAYVSSAVGLINMWNRLGAAMQWTPPKRHSA